MIVIDTNVVSELMCLAPDPAVTAWFSGQDSVGLHLTAVSEAELRAGAAILPAGRGRDRLAAEIDAMIGEDFAGRVLPFDSAAARTYAAIVDAQAHQQEQRAQTDLEALIETTPVGVMVVDACTGRPVSSSRFCGGFRPAPHLPR
ncbi:MAG: VapC toxin family PIN domain ribonuclease [Alphaproteobacteria bacterium]|nr:VapC toxin family PIN domain ribonuclease [Alphaproteobacteria bacterium]